MYTPKGGMLRAPELPWIPKPTELSLPGALTKVPSKVMERWSPESF